MWVLAHRGLHTGDLPENTLEAFHAALAVGVDGIETDVRQTRDGEFILFHDRFGPDGREIQATSRAELAAMVHHPIPTLEEALHTWPGIFWNLDLKGPIDLAALLETIRRNALTGHLLVTSFVHPLIEELSGQAHFECGFIVAHHPVRFGARPDWIPRGPRLNSVVWYFEAVDEALLADAAAGGLQSFVYGAVTPEEHSRLAALDLAGIITDYPGLLRPATSAG